MLCVGSLDKENTVHMTFAIRKRLSIIFSYGGQVQDLKEVLGLVAKGTIRPLVETKQIGDFPEVLRDLHEGKIKGRIALLHG
jgi:propanol-preferring alcohol dehydrogenase